MDNQQKSQQESQQESQQNADQPELLLRNSSRDQLIASLNELSEVLRGSKPISEDAKRSAIKMIYDSMQSLVLSSFGPFSFADDSNQKTISDQQFFKLSKAESSRIRKHLIEIRDTLLFDRLILDETKNNLLTENEQIICQLQGELYRDPISKADEEKITDPKNEEDKTIDANNEEPKKQVGKWHSVKLLLLNTVYSIHISIHYP